MDDVVSRIYCEDDGLVAVLVRMYSLYARAREWNFSEESMAVRGRGAYQDLRYEIGIHRFKRLPPSEEKGRVFTSKVRVTVEGDSENEATIRTYNLPGNRVTDHRIPLTLERLDLVLEGRLDPLIDALRAKFG